MKYFQKIRILDIRIGNHGIPEVESYKSTHKNFRDQKKKSL